MLIQQQVCDYHIKIWCNLHVTSVCMYESHRLRQAVVVVHNELEVGSSLIAFVHISEMRGCAVLHVVNNEWYYSVQMDSHPRNILFIPTVKRACALHQAVIETVCWPNIAVFEHVLNNSAKERAVRFRAW